jgi:hypothetical protein
VCVCVLLNNNNNNNNNNKKKKTTILESRRSIHRVDRSIDRSRSLDEEQKRIGRGGAVKRIQYPSWSTVAMHRMPATLFRELLPCRVRFVPCLCPNFRVLGRNEDREMLAMLDDFEPIDFSRRRCRRRRWMRPRPQCWPTFSVNFL